jgi:transcriptional regulator with XRE-family HTH domain
LYCVSAKFVKDYLGISAKIRHCVCANDWYQKVKAYSPLRVVVRFVIMPDQIGQRVRRLRIGKGSLRKPDITQKALAEKAGIDVATLNQIENGKREAKTPTVQALARALGVPSSAIMDGDGARSTAIEAPQPVAANAQAVQRIDLSAAIQAATQEAVADFAHALLDSITAWLEAGTRGQITGTRASAAGRPPRA